MMESIPEGSLSITHLLQSKQDLSDSKPIKDVCYKFLNLIYCSYREISKSNCLNRNQKQSLLKFEFSVYETVEKLRKLTDTDEDSRLDIERALSQSIANFFMGTYPFREQFPNDRVYHFIDHYLTESEGTILVVINNRTYQHSKVTPQSVEDTFIHVAQNGDLKKVTSMIDKEYLDQDVCQKAFMFSLQNGHPKVAKAIYKLADNIELNECDDCGNSCLMLALQNGMYDFINKAIKENIDTINLAHHNKKYIHLFTLALQKHCLDQLELKPFIDKKLHVRSFDGNSPLIYAIQAKNVDGVKKLLELKVDPNRPGRVSFSMSNFSIMAEFIYADAMSHLTDRKARNNQYMSSHFSPYTFTSNYEYFLAFNGSHMRAADEVFATRLKRKSVAQVENPLCAAICNESDEIAELLIDYGAKVNVQLDDGVTPLQLAVLYKNSKIIKLLIEAGADVNKSDQFGNTPLIYAAMNGLEDITEILINEGADIEHQNDAGKTALITAASFNRMEVVKKLYNQNTFSTKKDKDGFTALHAAAKYSNNSSMVKYMLEMSVNNIFIDLQDGLWASIFRVLDIRNRIDQAVNNNYVGDVPVFTMHSANIKKMIHKANIDPLMLNISKKSRDNKHNNMCIILHDTPSKIVYIKLSNGEFIPIGAEALKTSLTTTMIKYHVAKNPWSNEPLFIEDIFSVDEIIDEKQIHDALKES